MSHDDVTSSSDQEMSITETGEKAVKESVDRVPQGPFKGQPHWLPRLTVVLIAMAGVAGALWTFQQLSWLLAPAFFGLNLVIATFPLYTWLVSKKAPRWLAALILALALLAIMVFLVLLTTWAISTLIEAIPGYVPRMTQMYNDGVDWLISLGVSPDALDSMYTNIDPNSLISALSGLVGSLTGTVSSAVVIFTMALMVVIDSTSWMNRMKIAGQGHPRIIAALHGFSRGTRRYWIVCTIFGLIMAGLNWLELTILGVPLVGVWTLLTFITTYIPSVGFFFAMVPPVSVAFLVNGWQNGLWVMGVYFVTTWIVQGFFQPKFSGNAIGVNITVSFLSLLFWGWVFGPLGALIALPATQLVKSLVIDADPKSRWFNAFIATEPDLTFAEGQT